jgi:threonine/homoserine/homoserine lactone efflux protein
MLGVSLGFVFMTILVGIGIIKIFEALPTSYQVLKVLSVAYLLYMPNIDATETSSSASQLSSFRRCSHKFACCLSILYPINIILLTTLCTSMNFSLFE